MPGWSQFVGLLTEGLVYLTSLTGNAGLAIVVFTIIVKTVLLPLTLPALRNSRRQQELAPLVREIQKKHGKDRAAATQEQMELYRQYGFNPMSGCLPMLVQLPIFLALWQGITRLPEALEAAGRSLGGFLWIDSWQFADPWRLLPILAAAAQFLQSRMAMQPSSKVVDPQQQSMNRMMQFMPILVIVFGWGIPAGAVLYWFISSLYSAVMQYFITGWGSLRDLLPFLPEKELKSALPPRKAEGYAGGSGRAGFMQRFQERMIDAQRQQQEAQAQGGSKTQAAVDTAVQASTPRQPAEAADIRHTDDAWRLPGAPGTRGRTAFATGTPAADAGTARPGSSSNKQRPQNKRRKRK